MGALTEKTQVFPPRVHVNGPPRSSHPHVVWVGTDTWITCRWRDSPPENCEPALAFMKSRNTNAAVQTVFMSRPLLC
jgi:hypothetical protein